MVSLVVATLIFAALYAIIISGRTFWLSQDTVITTQDEARRATDFMSMELASAVDLDSNPTTQNIDSLTTATVTSIAFKVPVYCDGAYALATNSDGDGLVINVGGSSYYIESVIDQVTGSVDAGAYLANEDISIANQARSNRRIVYSILNNQLIRTVEGPGGPESSVLANNITGLRFRKRNVFGGAVPERRIVIIEVDALKNIFPGRQAPGDPANTITLVTRVALRN